MKLTHIAMVQKTKFPRCIVLFRIYFKRNAASRTLAWLQKQTARRVRFSRITHKRFLTTERRGSSAISGSLFKHRPPCQRASRVGNEERQSLLIQNKEAVNRVVDKWPAASEPASGATQQRSKRTNAATARPEGRAGPVARFAT